MNCSPARVCRRLLWLSLWCPFVMLSSLSAQRITGGIKGAVTDASGSAVPGVTIAVIDEATRKTLQTKSQADGIFEVIDLLPGNYTVTAEAQGFAEVKLEHVVVEVAAVASITLKLSVGQISQVITVSAADRTQVDTVSTEVGGVVNSQEIEQLALSGRNVMDLAQLQPGVQLRDASDIDPTKNNMEVISLQGRSGRETRTQWDGLSVQDPMFGGPAVNVGLDAIQEFQVAEAVHDPAQSVASSGAINMITRRGGNDLHGSGFGFFRDHRFAARIAPVATPYDRYQVGGRLGGAIVKDKLFFFTDIERTDTRDSFYANPPIFTSLKGTYPKPFTDNFGVIRSDWTPTSRLSVFARESYGWNRGVVGFPSLGAQYLDGFTNYTNNHIQAVGASLTSSRWTQDWRYGRVSFKVLAGGAPDLPTPRDALGRPYNITVDGGATLAIGPNFVAPEVLKARTNDAKDEIGWVGSHHVLRFGADLTYEEFAADTAVSSLGPTINTVGSATGVVDPTSPYGYPLESMSLGNGLGYPSVMPALGLPHGGFLNWQPAGYIHDTWSLEHHVSLNFGLRYMYQSGIFNSNIKRDPSINQFIPGYGNSTTQPKRDFAPEAGVAWDPTGQGKTVIRSAAGLYYEAITFEEYYLDPISFIPTNIGLNIVSLSPGTPLIDPRSGAAFSAGDPLATANGYPHGTGANQLAPLFGQPISTVASQINDLQALFQAASLQASTSSAPTLFQTTHQISYNLFGTTAWTPHPVDPRTLDFNIGAQHEFRSGLTMTVEYVKVRALDFPLVVDKNHVGNASGANFDPNLAAAAISAGNSSVGCPANAAATAINCAIAKGANIATYGSAGLGEGPAFQGFAFRGQNPNFGVMDYFLPQGGSNYNGMNIRLDSHSGPMAKKDLTWMKGNEMTVSYALSRLTGNVRGTAGRLAEIGAFASAWDNNNTDGSKVSGPMGLDRTQMFNISTITEIKGGFRFSQITHLFSAFAQNTLLPTGLGLGVASGTQAPDGCAGGAEEIFCTDVTGDGTTNDLLPGVRPGQFGRGLKGSSGLNKAISSYDDQSASHLTPAGQLLVNQGLFSTSQLQQLGAVMPHIPLAPQGQAGLDPLLLTDVRIAYHRKISERGGELETSLDVFNLFNRTSFDPPNNTLDGNLRGTIGTINGTLPSQRVNVRTRGSGTFEAGARRALQAGIRLTF
jgi:hypothetical protein